MRRVYLLAIILVVIALPLVTRTTFRRKPPAPPPVQVAPNWPPVAPSPAPVSDAPPEAPKDVPEPEAAQQTGWLNVRLDLGGESAPEKLNIRVYSHTGIELSEELPAAESIKLGPLTVGEKAVFIYPGSSSFGAAAVVAKVVEQAEVDVLLKLPKSFSVTGVVVDNTGRPVPGLTVEIEELLPLEFRRPEGTKERTASGGFGGRNLVTTGRRAVSSHWSFMMTPAGIRFQFDGSTDEKGRFTLPHGPSQPAATLSVLRDKAILTKETVVLSPEPLRLMIPVQPDEPKK